MAKYLSKFQKMNFLKAIIHIHEIKESLKKKKALSREKFAKKTQNALDLILKKFDLALNNRNLALVGTLLIVITSIILRSTRDIGFNSAQAIDLTSIFVIDKRSFQLSFNDISVITFYFNLIPYFFSKVADINIIISHFLFNNIIGLLSIFYSAKILRKNKISQENLNLIILSFAAGYFWRIFNLNFNEFDTQTSNFLVLFFPYISYQLTSHKNFKIIDHFTVGILASIIICLKFEYIFLIIIFELLKIIREKSINYLFIARNLITLVITYTIFLTTTQNLFSINFSSILYLPFHLFNLKDHFSLIILLYLIFNKKIREDKMLLFFVILSLSSILIILGSSPKNLDQISLFYSLSLPAIILLAIYFIRLKQINLVKNWFYIIPFIFLPILSQQQFSQIILQIPNLWWIFSIFIVLKYRTKSSKINIDSQIAQILIPLKFRYLLAFALLLLSLFIASKILIIKIFLWLANIYFFYILTIWDSNIHYQLKKVKNSKLYIFTIIAIFTHIIGLISQGFTLNDSQNLATKYKSPNFVNEQIIKNIKSYSYNDKATIIGDNICDQYPVTKYFTNQNNIKNIGYGLLYNQINFNNNPKLTKILAQEELDKLIDNIKNQSQVLIIKNYDDNYRRNCEIGFLEFYLRNNEFREAFIDNFQFANRIQSFEHQKAEITIEEKSNLQQELDKNGYNRLIKDYEVYIKK